VEQVSLAAPHGTAAEVERVRPLGVGERPEAVAAAHRQHVPLDEPRCSGPGDGRGDVGVHRQQRRVLQLLAEVADVLEQEPERPAVPAGPADLGYSRELN
jgi:hypothetical protein